MDEHIRSVRLALPIHLSTAPSSVRLKKYMVTNWIAIAALFISLLGVIVAVIALFKKGP